MKNQISTRTTATIVSDKTPFNIMEAYKSARTNIMFALTGEGCKNVIITSPFPREGKTTTCVNLAIVFAQMGAKVLLMECDLRKPRIHKIFKETQKEGITSVLTGQKKWKEVIRKSEETGVDYLISGVIPKNPAELLGSTQMSKLIEELSEHYDYIFMDTPPVNVVTDALVLAPMVSGVFMVVRQGITEHKALKDAIDKFKFIDIDPLGILLNDANYNNSLYKYSYKNYRYRYKYSYSKGYRYGSYGNYNYGPDRYGSDTGDSKQ